MRAVRHAAPKRKSRTTGETIASSSVASDARINSIMRENNVNYDVASKIAELLSVKKTVSSEEVDHTDQLEDGNCSPGKNAYADQGDDIGEGGNDHGKEQVVINEADGESDKDEFLTEDKEKVEEHPEEGSVEEVDEEDDIARRNDFIVDITNNEEDLDVSVPELNEDSDEEHTQSRQSTDIPPPLTAVEEVRTGTVTRNGENNAEAAPMNSRIEEPVLRFILGKMEQCVTDNINSSFGEFMSKMGRELDEVAKIRSQMLELTNVVTASASAMFIKQPGAVPRMKDIHRKICLLPALFNDNFLSKIMARCILGVIYNKCTNQSVQSLLAAGTEMITVLYFSRKPDEKWKDKYESDIGKIFSRFRNGFMLSAFLAMQENKFGTFTSHEKQQFLSADANSSSPLLSHEAVAVPIVQPFWLKPGYIVTEHCLSAASKYEKKGCLERTESSQTLSLGDNDSSDPVEQAASAGKAKAARSGPISRNEIAIEASCLVYKLITSLLHRARTVSRLCLFENLMYLFTSWAQFDAPVLQSTLSIGWEEISITSASWLEDLPKTTMISSSGKTGANSIDTQQSDVDNLKVLQQLIAIHPELSLIVEHDVLVDGKKRSLRYRISMLEVACNFFASYTNIEVHSKPKDTLSLDPNVLKMAVVIAFGLRRLLEKAVSDTKSQRGVPWGANRDINKRKGRRKTGGTTNSTADSVDIINYKFEDFHGLSVGTLMPAWTKQRDMLLQMLLNLSEAEYYSRHDGADPFNQSGNDGGRANRIQADEDLGIFSV